MMAEIFEEVLECEADEEVPDETKGSTPITVANSTSEVIVVELEPIKMVQQSELRERQVGFGAGMDGQLGFTYKQSAVNLEEYNLPERQNSIAPHGLWSINIPRESLRPWRKGNAAMVDNTITMHIYYTEEKGINGKYEIGKGFILGPGHGVIVSLVREKYQVEQVKGRSWFRRYDCWITNTGGNRDPHAELRKFKKCSVCKIMKQ
eukprot:TRINITY_DN17921_c0_g1_i1.p1 TRINITY_DN17921_c0_g1~~TRINITY_DN17921_c0_g1_i1.p1  ORF type:complete len:206 (-),score=47.08 TRINITY_DN17921_c0_g1_i1:35-652(-)